MALQLCSICNSIVPEHTMETAYPLRDEFRADGERNLICYHCNDMLRQPIGISAGMLNEEFSNEIMKSLKDADYNTLKEAAYNFEQISRAVTALYRIAKRK